MMPKELLIISAIVLLMLLSSSIYEHHSDPTSTEAVKCLEPVTEGSNQFPAWTGTPYFSPRCD